VPHGISLSRLPRRARLLEPAVLAASCLLVFWLSRGERGPEPLPGAFVSPWWSFVAVVAAAWLVPGYVLCSLLRVPRGGGWTGRLAFSFGLGAAWLAAPAAAVLLVRGSLDRLAVVVTGLQAMLVAAYLLARWRGRADHGPPPPSAAASAWIAAAGALAFAHLESLAMRRPRFTFGSDEWILMRAIRYFLEAPAFASTWDFDVWDLVVALLVRLARVDLLDAYRLYLPAVLILAASAAFLALADALFDDRTVSWFAYLVLALYALSDMQPRGEGMGMGLLVRIAEDKYVALLVLLPLAQAAVVGFLRGRGTAPLAVAAVLGLAGTVVYPLAAVWLALSAGTTALAAVVTGQLRIGRRPLALLAGGAAAAVAIAAWLRAQRADPYFALYAPEWPFNAVLRGLSRRQLHVFSLERASYMAHPALLAHPLTISGILAALSLVPRFRQSLPAQFLVCSTFAPLLLAYNPLTAPWLGAWITPWAVYRVVWIVPVALTLGWTLHRALAAVQARLAHGAERAPAAGRSAALWLATAATLAVLLVPRVELSWRAFKERNRVRVPPGERELMHAIGRERQLGGRVLAPRDVAVRLPAWTSRLHPYPSLDAMRVATPEMLQEWEAFYAARSIGEREVTLLMRHGIDYVIAPAGSPLDRALRAAPASFRIVYDGDAFALFAWRPERWRPAADTSVVMSAGNPAAPPP
jgi:hypothetical protein